MRGGLSAFIAGLGEVEFMSLRKPYRSVDEQLRILRSRGMAVDAGAGHVLRREGYYPIVNGYKDLFLDRKACLTAGDDRYGTGARFDDLYALFRSTVSCVNCCFPLSHGRRPRSRQYARMSSPGCTPTRSTRISIPTIMIPGAVRAPWR